MARVVPSERAEKSRAELMFAWAAYARWRRQQRVIPFGRLSRYHLGAATGVGYLTLPYIAAVAEEFSRNMLLSCSEPLVPQAHALLRELWATAEGRVETWPGQVKAWEGWHGIPVSKSAEYKKFRGVIEARNAVVHGLGELTRRQTRAKDGGRSVIHDLSQVGIRVSGRRLEVDDDAIRRSVDAARRFVEWLDTEIQSRGIAAAALP
jgi:hypothetical protein